MSTADSEQDKQPISAVNGQTAGDIPPGKDDTNNETPSAEGLKATPETKADMSNQNEGESAADGEEEDKAKDSMNSVVNGESTRGHEDGELPEKEHTVGEYKPEELQDSKQVDNVVEAAVENQTGEDGKEGEKSAEISEPEKNNYIVVIEINGDQDKVETVPEKVEDTEAKEGEEAGDKCNEEQSENQPSEESKVAVTDPEVADRKRAVTIDNPSDMRELTEKSGESSKEAQDISVHDRSKTLGDIEGSASTPWKEDVAARSRTIWYTDEDADSKPESAATEETVSYSTSIVGGVVHRVPISSNSPKTQHKSKEGSSPKTQHKPKEGSPQFSTPKKRSVIESLFGRRKKSKGGPESPPGVTPNDKDVESSPASPDADAAKESTEPKEEVEASKDTDTDQRTEGEVKLAAAEEGGDNDSKPPPSAAAADAAAVVNEDSEQGVKEEGTEASKESEVEECKVESQDVQEVSAPVEGGEEKGETSTESPKDEEAGETKDAVKRTHTDHPEEEETSPPPAAKKKKTIFGGIFTRRKSKKSKGEDTSSPAETQEEKDDKPDEEPQPVGDTKPPDAEGVETAEDGTDQGETGDTTATAQQEVAEDVISPAVDHAVESAQEEIVQKDNVDDNIEGKEEEPAPGGEPSSKEVEDNAPEDDKKSSEEPMQSESGEGTVKKDETEEKPVTTQESQPEKKKSFFGGFLARRKSKKSKDVDDGPATETSQQKEGDKVEEEQGESTSTQPADDAKPDSAEGKETSDHGQEQVSAPDASDATATVQKEATEDVISPAVDKAVESTREEVAESDKVHGIIEGQETRGDESVGNEVPSGDDEKSSEGVVQPKETEDTAEKKETEEKAVTVQESQPEKKKSIFGGFFARRKSTKTKDDDRSPSEETPQEKEGDKVEEHKDESGSTLAADDTTPHAVESEKTVEDGTDQDAAPEPSDITATAQNKVVEEVISPTADQAVESAPEEKAVKDKVDGNIEGQETKGDESVGNEVQTVALGDDEKSSEGLVQPKEAEDTVEKKEIEEKTVTVQESQPEKKKSIFGGFFARRKSKKSKDDGPSPPEETPQEQEGDKAEEHKDESGLTLAADDTTPHAVEGEKTVENGTDQDAAPEPSDITATAQNKVVEEVISPTADHAIESAPEEKSVKDKVDGETGGPEVETVGAVEPNGKEVETVVTVNGQKSTEEEKGNDEAKVEESSRDTGKEISAPTEPTAEKLSSPETEEAQDKADTALKERQALMKGSHSPKTRRMQMRISYAETDGEGGREVEVIGTPEKAPDSPNQKGKTPPDHRVSCRALGEADHEGWLAKKGGPLFFSSWKRKWVVLKEGKLYYFKTAFDPEASGVINMQGITVAQAPETKKNFCFKCEQPGTKPQVALFMADSKDDMEKWTTVLTAASRGEAIQKTKQHLAVRDEVVMRKKSGSVNAAQRTSSVLAVGGRHDLFEDEEDMKAIRRKSTPGSFSKASKETEAIEETTTVPSDAHPASDTQPVPSSTVVSEPPEDSQKDTKESGDSQTTDKTVPAAVEVVVSGEQVVVESAPPVEASPGQDAPTVESSGDGTPTVAAHEKDKGGEGHVEVTTETVAAQSQQESVESVVDTTDGAESVVTTMSSVTVVETITTTSVVSEKVETVVSVVKTEETEVSCSEHQTETVEFKQDVMEDISETSRTEPDASEPVSPSKTKWYFTLDRQETWSVSPEVDEKKSPTRSDRGSIKSDQGSIKSSSDDDQLLVMCRNIKKARLSIVGDAMLEGADRLRAWSNVEDRSEEQAFVRLKTLERTLKDKEKHLSELEELLTQPEINRDSIYAWKLRYSDLVEELFPTDDGGDGQEEVEGAVDGAEGETQDQENSAAGKEDEKLKSTDVEGTEKEVKEGGLEVEEKKSEEESATSKENQENVDHKEATGEGKESSEEKLDVAKEEQLSSEGREETQEKENDNITPGVDQSQAEGVPLSDAEQNVHETGTVDDKQAREEEISTEQKLSEGQEEGGEQSNGDTEDTHL